MCTKASIICVSGFNSVEADIILFLDKKNGVKVDRITSELGLPRDEILLALGALRYRGVLYSSFGNMWILNKTPEEICIESVKRVFNE